MRNAINRLGGLIALVVLPVTIACSGGGTPSSPSTPAPPTPPVPVQLDTATIRQLGVNAAGGYGPFTVTQTGTMNLTASSISPSTNKVEIYLYDEAALNGGHAGCSNQGVATCVGALASTTDKGTISVPTAGAHQYHVYFINRGPESLGIAQVPIMLTPSTP